QDIRYDHISKKWLIFDGCRWKYDNTGEIKRRAKDTVRQIYREAAEIEDDDAREARAKWALRSEGESRIKSMIALAESGRGIPITPEELDLGGWLLNCKNGTVDLRTGELRQHRREDMITKLVQAFAHHFLFEFLT
ncbi:putative DNA primase/helicase, partial [Candidatus Hakubella thermalkaliphila]